MLKLKAASFGVVRLQIENRILENNIKISCQPFPEKKKKKKKKSVKQPDLELGGRGGGNLMVIVVRVCKSVLQTYPIHILGLWKNGPIHILDRLKCWPIYILPFDFLYPFIAGC